MGGGNLGFPPQSKKQFRRPLERRFQLHTAPNALRAARGEKSEECHSLKTRIRPSDWLSSPVFVPFKRTRNRGAKLFRFVPVSGGVSIVCLRGRLRDV